MRKIKYILLIFVILLLTGCSGNYNLKFNKDLSVDEELIIAIENNEDTYERTHQLFEKANIDSDKYEIMIEGEEVKIIYKEKYSSFEKYYLDSKLYKTLFKDIEYNKDNTGMSINAESSFKLDDKDSQNIVNAYDIDNFKINISTPYSVRKSNADSVKDNTYTWNLNSKDTYKNISISYDYKNDKTASIILLVLMGVISLGIITYLIVYLLRNKRI